MALDIEVKYDMICYKESTHLWAQISQVIQMDSHFQNTDTFLKGDIIKPF